jgi:preprotein translocase subunit SecA
MMEGRRYSEGLHQALEAKENVAIQNENQTLASITFQNYFRMYTKLAGMTGTAMTEAAEFSDIYKLEVVEIPTHRTISRIDEDDDIYRTAQEKYDAIVEEISGAHEKGQPILVGTVSIEKSELVSALLRKKKIKHHVLNAKHHEQEAFIIAQAGRLGAVTIATNMAGRGTDIMLGGNPDMMIQKSLAEKEDLSDEKKKTLIEKVKAEVAEEKRKTMEAGGLYVLGTERHESRRIDNQLRGRSGRQGDPGRTKFFLSLEDDLMRIFGSERIGGMLQKLGLKEGEAITHPWISRAIEKAQKKVEAHHYDIRKNLLKFDDVMNDQRKVIFDQRIEIMEEEDLSDLITEMREDINADMVQIHIPSRSYAEQWDVEGLEHECQRIYGVRIPVKEWAAEEGIAEDEILERINQASTALFNDKEAHYGSKIIRIAEKRVLLLSLDQLWKDHLLALDHLRQGINLRAYGQKDPLNEYKREAFGLFESMLDHLRGLVVNRLAYIEFTVDPKTHEALAQMPVQNTGKMIETRQDPALATKAAGVNNASQSVIPVRQRVKEDQRDPSNSETWGRIGRNEACPCGSGKKYKQCHGKLA